MRRPSTSTHRTALLPGPHAPPPAVSAKANRAIPFRVAAAEAALRVHALTDAQLHYGYALADAPDHATCVDIQLALARLHNRSEATEAADRALESAVETANAVAEPSMAAALQLRVQLAMARHWITSARIDPAAALLRALAPRIEAAPITQRLDALEIRADLLQAQNGDAEEVLRLLAQAITLCEQDGAAMARMAVLHVRTARTALGMDDRAIAIDASRLEMKVRERADDALQRAIPLLEALAQPGDLALALVLRAQLHAARADHVSAERDLQRARKLGMRSGHLPATRAALAGLAALATSTGDTAAAAQWRSEDEAHAQEA